MIKTLCYTFLQVGSTQIIMELENINHEKGLETLKDLFEGQKIDMNAAGKSLIIGGATGGVLFTLVRVLTALGIALA